MRQLLCEECVTHDRRLREGSFIIFAATVEEPAEHARVVKGRAKPPTVEQRTIHIHADRQQTTQVMDSAFYNCDRCNGKIRPGDPVYALTVWIPARQSEPPRWEDAYLYA